MYLRTKHRKRILLALLLSVITILSNAQAKTDTASKKVKNIIWFTPNGVDQINGIAVGIQAINFNERPLVINGLNADVAMISMMALPYAVAYCVSPKTRRVAATMEYDTAETYINGISLSIGGEIAVSVNGINIAGLVTGATSLNGISVTALFTKCTRFKGIVFSGIYNEAKTGIGLQIGLFNRCEKLKGLQIGLWNKSGKRGLPLFNWGI